MSNGPAGPITKVDGIFCMAMMPVVLGLVVAVTFVAADALALIVTLPDGTELSAQRVDVHPDAQTVVIYEAPLMADGFE